MNAFFILLVGLLLVLLEFYLPGAIMGTAGAILIIFSIFTFASQSDSPLAVLLFSLGAIIGFGGVIKFALWHIRGTGKNKTIFLESDQEGFRASEFDQSTIGKVGTALSDLKPGGYILLEGKKYAVLSQSGYILKGSEVVVISGQGESLIVKLKDHHSK